MTALANLLKAYADILIHIEQGPRYPLTAVAQGWLMSKIKIPISRSFVIYVLSVHIDKVLEFAKRSVRLRVYSAALDTGPLSDHQDVIKALDDFQKVLPKISYKLLMFIYAGLIILIAQNTFTSAQDAVFANNILLSLIKLDVKGFLDSFNSVEDQSIFWRLPLFWIMVVSFLACPIYTAFIYKRILLNVYPNLDAIRGAHMTDHFDSRQGIYELEHSFFKAASLKAVHETPIDLIVFGLLYVFGLCCGLLPAYIAITTGITFWYYVAIPNIIISLFMLISLYMTKTARYG